MRIQGGKEMHGFGLIFPVESQGSRGPPVTLHREREGREERRTNANFKNKYQKKE